jgi:hypothetical protein
MPFSRNPSLFSPGNPILNLDQNRRIFQSSAAYGTRVRFDEVSEKNRMRGSSVMPMMVEKATNKKIGSDSVFACCFTSILL